MTYDNRVETLITDIRDLLNEFLESADDDVIFDEIVELDTDEDEDESETSYTDLNTSSPLSKSDKIRKRFEYQRIPVEYELRNCEWPGLTKLGIALRVEEHHGVDMSTADVMKRVSDLRKHCGVDVVKNKIDVDGEERTFYFIQ